MPGEQPEAVIFIGIQASGKSTFYQERFAGSHIRINLDLLKTRKREDGLLEECIRNRQSFVVDNTNVLAREREKYISLARAAGYTIIGYYFHTSLQDALRRNRQREGKAVIPVPGVIAKYRAMQRPSYSEGFDRLYFVSIDEQNGFAVEPWQENQAH